MATTALNAGDHGAYGKTLVANTVDTVQFPQEVFAEVWADGSAAVYFTADGSTPTVAGQATWEIPPQRRQVSGVLPAAAAGTVVKLISAGTPKYSVSGSA